MYGYEPWWERSQCYLGSFICGRCDHDAVYQDRDFGCMYQYPEGLHCGCDCPYYTTVYRTPVFS